MSLQDKFLTNISDILLHVKVLDKNLDKYEEDETDKENVAEALSKLDDILNWLKDIKGTLTSQVKKLNRGSGDKYIPIKSGGTIEVKTGVPRKKWDHAALTAIASEKILEDCIDPETGAFEVPPSQIPQMMLDYVSISSWKVTKLKEKGIDPDNYCEVQPANTSAIIRK